MQGLIKDEIDVHNEITVDLLKNVANTRFILSSTASILQTYCKLKASGKRSVDKEYQKLFALLMKFILKVRKSEIHMFFLREVIRRYGVKELDNIVKETEFTWLNLEVEDPTKVRVMQINILNTCNEYMKF